MKFMEMVRAPAIYARVKMDEAAGRVLMTGLGGLALAMPAQSAHAASLKDWVARLKGETQGILQSSVYLFYAFGVVLILLALSKAVAKSKGDHQTTTGSIIGYFLGGACFCAAGIFVDAVTESVSGTTGGTSQFH